MYYILANETHLKGKGLNKLEEVKKIFEIAGKDADVLFTQKTGDAKIITQKITSTGEKHTVIAMGGDGTLHDIINGIKDFDNCALGLIPFGTGNDFAEAAGIPLNPVKAAEIIAFRAPQKIDYIELSSGLRSINSVGMGIDVEILKRVYNKNMRGRSKYLRSLIYTLFHYKSINFKVRYDGVEERHFGLIAAVGNGLQLGGGIKLFPDAKINDGYMDLLICDYISKSKIPGELLKLMRGKVRKVKNITYLKTKSVEFIPENDKFTVQAEGELYESAPFKACIAESKLNFYLP